MKWLLLLPGFLLLTASLANAQRTKLFRSIIHTSQGERIDGILYDVTDSTVQYVPNQADFIQRLRAGQIPAVFDVHRNTINRIVIRRKGHVGRGALIGAGLGLVTGIGMAVFTRPLPDAGLYTELLNLSRVGAILTAPLGGAQYGALFSIIPYRIKRIRQNADAYESAKGELRRLSFVHQQRANSFPPAGVTLLNQHP